MMNNSRIVLDFMGHTDFAAAIRPSYHCPGAAKLASAFEIIRKQNPAGTILLDAGDVLVGAPIMNLTHGEPVMEIVNSFGYDAMTLGNHEFDQGSKIMEKILSLATFPLLCANIIEKKSGALIPYVNPYIVLEKKGVRIGVLGVTTEYTPYMVKADAFEGFEMRDVVETCKHYIPIMRKEGAEIIVVLGHLPGTRDENGVNSGELFNVAASVSGIDILFGGHNPGDIAVSVNGTLISKTGFSAISIGHIQISYDQDTKRIECTVNEIMPVLDGNLAIEPDPAVEIKVARAMEPYIRTLDEVIGEAESDLIVSFEAECSLGNFFTDCIKDTCEAQIGLMNSTSCFGYVPKGPITSEMIMWVMCFNDNLFTGFMTGRQIQDMLELTYEKKHQSLNGSLQLSGMNVVLDSSRPDFQKIISLKLDNGTPLLANEKYLVSTSAYIASGGNEYRAITRLTDWQKTDHMSHPTFIEGMRKRKRLNSPIEGRIIDLAN
jgi:2',3'-cyclic-nucleotide 2'-phosphodiesterase (5'-nucleotidase family)